MSQLPALLTDRITDVSDYENVGAWWIGLRGGTQRVYKKSLELYFGTFTVLDDANLTTYITHSLQGRSHAYVVQQFTILKKAALEAGHPIKPVTSRFITNSLKSLVESGSNKRKKPKGSIDPDELNRMLALPDETGDSAISARNRFLIALTWAGGFRVSEVATLTIAQIVIRRERNLMTILLTHRKNMKSTDEDHKVYIESADIISMFDDLYSHDPKDGWSYTHPVFFDFRFKRPTSLSYSTCRRIVQGYAKRAGVAVNVGTHSLRIGYDNTALSLGVSPSDIGVVTGQTPATVETYRRASQKAHTSHVGHLVNKEN